MNTRWMWIACGLYIGAAAGADGSGGDLAMMDSLGVPMAVGELANQDGRADNPPYLQVPQNESAANNGGQLDNNSLVSSVTGANSVGANGFSQINGVGTLIQNSGNQVLIQNSTILNLSLY